MHAHVCDLYGKKQVLSISTERNPADSSLLHNILPDTVDQIFFKLSSITAENYISLRAVPTPSTIAVTAFEQK